VKPGPTSIITDGPGEGRNTHAEMAATNASMITVLARGCPAIAAFVDGMFTRPLPRSVHGLMERDRK